MPIAKVGSRGDFIGALNKVTKIRGGGWNGTHLCSELPGTLIRSMKVVHADASTSA